MSVGKRPSTLSTCFLQLEVNEQQRSKLHSDSNNNNKMSLTHNPHSVPLQCSGGPEVGEASSSWEHCWFDSLDQRDIWLEIRETGHCSSSPWSPPLKALEQGPLTNIHGAQPILNMPSTPTTAKVHRLPVLHFFSFLSFFLNLFTTSDGGTALHLARVCQRHSAAFDGWSSQCWLCSENASRSSVSIRLMNFYYVIAGWRAWWHSLSLLSCSTGPWHVKESCSEMT